MIYITKDSTKPEFLISYEGGNCDKNSLYHPVDASPNITSPCGIHLRVRKPALTSHSRPPRSPLLSKISAASHVITHNLHQNAPKCTQIHQHTKIEPIYIVEPTEPIETIS